MAGPFVRLLANVVISGIGIVSKAFTQAYQREAAGGGGAKAAAQAATATFGRNRIKLDEARKILNIKEGQTRAEMKARYEYLFKANEGTDGSFYLQSKIYRAKERLDELYDELEGPEKEVEESEAKEASEGEMGEKTEERNKEDSESNKSQDSEEQVKKKKTKKRVHFENLTDLDCVMLGKREFHTKYAS
eukprot:g5769.t1